MDRFLRPIVVLPLLLLAISALVVPLASHGASQRGFTATTTLGVFADFARQVGGDRVEVVQLLADGVDTHSYQPTPTDLATVNRSRVFLYNGLDLEPFVPRMLAASVRPEVTRVELTAGLTPLTRDGAPDPHLWLDPQLAMRYVERIRDAFASVDPAGADSYRANADRYLAELRALDAELEQTLQQVPVANRKLLVSHDAFAYLARRYDFEEIEAVLSVEGQEPSPGELVELIRQARSTGVRAIFVEPQVPSRLAEQVAREANLRMLPLYSDAFPADGSFRTYTEMMRVNARNIVEGLR